MAHMQAEIESLRKSEENYRKKLRDMELDNDVLENSERYRLLPATLCWRVSAR